MADFSNSLYGVGCELLGSVAVLIVVLPCRGTLVIVEWRSIVQGPRTVAIQQVSGAHFSP